jgi:2-oxoglutarate ferredoxin oxidoreductase subunit gamma
MTRAMSKSPVQVRIGGEAGQGVILAGFMLAQAAMGDGRKVAQSARYGAAVRGGEATADLVISDTPIDYPHVETPDILVVFSQQTYDRFAPPKTEDTQVFYDPFFVTPSKTAGGSFWKISATEKAIERFGKSTSSNLIVLGFIAHLTEVVSEESLIAAIEQNLPPKHRAAGLEALQMGKKAALEAGG